MARKLDVGVSAVSLWERGVNVPNAHHLIALADLLGLHAGPLASEAAQSVVAARALCQDEASKSGAKLRVRRRHEKTLPDAKRSRRVAS